MKDITSLLWGLCIAAALFCCDACSLRAAESDRAASIREVRMGTLVIETAPGAEVRVEQMRHEFCFGAALASQIFGGLAGSDDAERYKKIFLENFNAAVTENALKWHSMEQTKGVVDYAVVDEILE